MKCASQVELHNADNLKEIWFLFSHAIFLSLYHTILNTGNAVLLLCQAIDRYFFQVRVTMEWMKSSFHMPQLMMIPVVEAMTGTSAMSTFCIKQNRAV